MPTEALLHQVGFDAQGGVVVDIWASRPAFEAWTESRIKPALAKYGLAYAEPRVLDVDVVTTTEALHAFTVLRSTAAA